MTLIKSLAKIPVNFAGIATVLGLIGFFRMWHFYNLLDIPIAQYIQVTEILLVFSDEIFESLIWVIYMLGIQLLIVNTPGQLLNYLSLLLGGCFFLILSAALIGYFSDADVHKLKFLKDFFEACENISKLIELILRNAPQKFGQFISFGSLQLSLAFTARFLTLFLQNFDDDKFRRLRLNLNTIMVTIGVLLVIISNNYAKVDRLTREKTGDHYVKIQLNDGSSVSSGKDTVFIGKTANFTFFKVFYAPNLYNTAQSSIFILANNNVRAFRVSAKRLR